MNRTVSDAESSLQRRSLQWLTGIEVTAASKLEELSEEWLREQTAEWAKAILAQRASHDAVKTCVLKITANSSHHVPFRNIHN